MNREGTWRRVALGILLLFSFKPGNGAAAERDAFPVPQLLVQFFEHQGLRVFDPFDDAAEEAALARLGAGPQTWPLKNLPRARKREQRMKNPPPEAGDSPGFDLLPLLTKQGWKPHRETLAIFLPRSQVVLAQAGTAADMEVLRAFCSWGIGWWGIRWWLGSEDESFPWVREAIIRTEIVSVSKSSAGGWKFRPSSPAGLMALPERARRTIARQSMTVRSGQRSKVTGQSEALLANGDALLSPLLETEAEVEIGDDGEMIDLQYAVSYPVRGEDPAHPEQSSVVTRSLIRNSGQMLLELPVVPGAPDRVFVVVSAALRELVSDEPRRLWLKGRALQADGFVNRVFPCEAESVFARNEPDAESDEEDIPRQRAIYPLPLPVPVAGSLAPVFAQTDAEDARPVIRRLEGPEITSEAVFFRGLIFFRGSQREAEELEAWTRARAEKDEVRYQNLPEFLGPRQWTRVRAEKYEARAPRAHVEALLFAAPASEHALPDAPDSQILSRSFFHVPSGSASGAYIYVEDPESGDVTGGISIAFESVRDESGVWSHQPSATVQPPFTNEQRELISRPVQADSGVLEIGPSKDGRVLFLGWKARPDLPVLMDDAGREMAPRGLQLWWEQTAVHADRTAAPK